MPEMYGDLWAAAKGMYNMEPAIADGGEVVIYAPRINEVNRILIMLPVGIMVACRSPVDSAIAHLKPNLERGDILMDGGNSFMLDTERRRQALAAEGFDYIGTSGGEEGALWGPAIMPGGQREAWEAVASILRAIAARAEFRAPSHCAAEKHLGAE